MREPARPAAERRGAGTSRLHCRSGVRRRRRRRGADRAHLAGIGSWRGAHQLHWSLRPGRLHAPPCHDDFRARPARRRPAAPKPCAHQRAGRLRTAHPGGCRHRAPARWRHGRPDNLAPRTEAAVVVGFGSAPPGVGQFRASLSARLPPWGRGVFEAATYFISLNVAGIAKPFLALQRPLVPGQELLSGFAISPALSPGDADALRTFAPRASARHFARRPPERSAYGARHVSHDTGW